MNGVKLADIRFSLLCVCLCALSGLNGRTAEKCIRLVCEKLRIFPYGQYIVGIHVSLAFSRYSRFTKIEVGVEEKCTKMKHHFRCFGKLLCEERL